MRLLAGTLVTAALAFAGCGGGEDMSKFDADLGKYMTQTLAKKGLPVKVTVTCHQDGDVICDVFHNGKRLGDANNVRRDGDKFVWDHEY